MEYLTNDEYHGRTDSYGSTHVKMALKDIGQFYHHAVERDAVVENKDAWVLGSAVHSLVLEPDTFHLDFCVLPESVNLRTKAGRAERDALIAGRPNTYVIRDAVRAQAQAMCDAVMQNREFSAILTDKNTHCEHCTFWTDPTSNVPLKAKWDIININPDMKRGVIVDLKTTRNPAPDSFNFAVVDYGYDVSAAQYLAGAVQEFGGLSGGWQWDYYLMAVGTEGSHPAALYHLSPDYIHVGRNLWCKAIDKIGWCLKSGVWEESYTVGQQELLPPGFRIKQAGLRRDQETGLLQEEGPSE